MQKRERGDEDAADMLERELKEEEAYDAKYKRSFFEAEDYDTERYIRSRLENGQLDEAVRLVYQNYSDELWFRRVISANSPRPPNGRAFASAPFPAGVAKRVFGFDRGEAKYYQYKSRRDADLQRMREKRQKEGE